MVQHCWNREHRSGVMERRTLEYRGRIEAKQEYADNLKEEENIKTLH